MTITLIRHAKVVINQRTKISALEMKAWVEEYDHAFVSHEVPMEKIIKHLKHADLVLASGLSRTKESLGLIGVKAKEHNSLFDEIALPTFENEAIKLYPKQWLMLLRFMLIFPGAKKHEILVKSRQRAKMAAMYLDRLVDEHQDVSLMGHGGMNWLMGKALEKLGWKCVENAQATKNWGYKVYEKKIKV